MPESWFRHLSQHRLARSANMRPVVGSMRCPSAAVAVDGVEEVAVGAELHLPCGGIPRTYGLAVPPAGYIERFLLVGDGSIKTVEDVEVAPIVTDGGEEPGHGPVDLFVQAEVQERIEGERRVSNPRVPVVPVLGAADALWERCGGGRGDGAGTLGQQQLERQVRTAGPPSSKRLRRSRGVRPIVATTRSSGPSETEWRAEVGGQRLGVGGDDGEECPGAFGQPAMTRDAVRENVGGPDAVDNHSERLVLDVTTGVPL